MRIIMSKQTHRSAVMTKKSKCLLAKTLEDRLVKYSTLIAHTRDDETYHLEEKWEELVDSSQMSETKRKQQFHIFEFISTEKNYIEKIRVICQVFRQIFQCLQNDGDLCDYQSKQVFGNIDEIFLINDAIWTSVIVDVITKTRHHKNMIKPSEIFASFVNTDEEYDSYLQFSMLQDACVENIQDFSENVKRNAEFVKYLQFCESVPSCNGWKLIELMVEPMKRITRYPMVLKEVLKQTRDEEEKVFLNEIIEKFERFVTNINTQLRKRSENEVLQNFLLEMEEHDIWMAGNEEVIWTATEFLRLPLKIKVDGRRKTEQRCLLKRGPMRILEEKRKVHVVAILFSDVFIMARQRKTKPGKLTLIKQMYFLDKLVLKRSEISHNALVLVYKNEAGLLSEALKLEIADGSREDWCTTLEISKKIYLSVRESNGSTLDIFKERYNRFDYETQRSAHDNLTLSKRSSSWLLTKDSVTALRESRNKERSASHDSFRRASSNPNLVDGDDELLPDICEDDRSDVAQGSRKYSSLRERKPHNKTILKKKFSFDSSSSSSTESKDSENEVFTIEVGENEVNNNNWDIAQSPTMCCSKRVNDNEVEIQTQVTFSNGFFYKTLHEGDEMSCKNSSCIEIDK